MFRWIQNLLLPKPIEHPCFEGHRINIRALGSTWSDQKLHDVYAFCEDGKMDFANKHCCLRGVATSEIPHTTCNDPTHYCTEDPLILAAEEAYLHLGYAGRRPAPVTLRQRTDGSTTWDSPMILPESKAQIRRDQELLTILRAEMTARELKRAAGGSEPTSDRRQKSVLGLKEF